MLPTMNVLSLATILLAAGIACALAQPVAAQSASSTQASTTPAKMTWFIRLIPPRPPFDKDLSEAEAKIMEQHFVYLKGLYERASVSSRDRFWIPKGFMA